MGPKCPPTTRCAPWCLTPRRERRAQVAESVREYGRIPRSAHDVVFGGCQDHPQMHGCAAAPNVLVATPRPA